MEGHGEKSGVDGEREGEGHCCKLAGRRIDIAVVVALGESEEVFIEQKKVATVGRY